MVRQICFFLCHFNCMNICVGELCSNSTNGMVCEIVRMCVVGLSMCSFDLSICQLIHNYSMMSLHVLLKYSKTIFSISLSVHLNWLVFWRENQGCTFGGNTRFSNGMEQVCVRMTVYHYIVACIQFTSLNVR